jgi:hypothetical protein
MMRGDSAEDASGDRLYTSSELSVGVGLNRGEYQLVDVLREGGDPDRELGALVRRQTPILLSGPGDLGNRLSDSGTVAPASTPGARWRRRRTRRQGGAEAQRYLPAASSVLRCPVVTSPASVWVHSVGAAVEETDRHVCTGYGYPPLWAGLRPGLGGDRDRHDHGVGLVGLHLVHARAVDGNSNVCSASLLECSSVGGWWRSCSAGRWGELPADVPAVPDVVPRRRRVCGLAGVVAMLFEYVSG